MFDLLFYFQYEYFVLTPCRHLFLLQPPILECASIASLNDSLFLMSSPKVKCRHFNMSLVHKEHASVVAAVFVNSAKAISQFFSPFNQSDEKDFPETNHDTEEKMCLHTSLCQPNRSTTTATSGKCLRFVLIPDPRLEAERSPHLAQERFQRG